MKKYHIIFLFSVLLMLAFFCSCSKKQPEDNDQYPDYSFAKDTYNEQPEGTGTPEDIEKTEDTTESTTADNSNNSDQSTADNSEQPAEEKKEWPYELDFKGVNSLEEVKTGNLRTNYRFNSYKSYTSCLVCPDIENDILYYANYDKDNYIYQLKDGTISLLVEKNAYCLQLWDNELYFLSCNQNINDENKKTGDIYCYNIDTKETRLILQANAFSLYVDSYGIFYQNVDDLNDSSVAGYHLDFDSTTPHVNVNITLYKKWNIKMYSLQPNQSSIAPSRTYCFSLSR